MLLRLKLCRDQRLDSKCWSFVVGSRYGLGRWRREGVTSDVCIKGNAIIEYLSQKKHDRFQL